MAYPTTAQQTELEAINEMLAAVGQAPVTSIDVDDDDNPTNPDVAMARETLQQVSREVQAEGWSFNREFNYPLTPDSDKHIVIPSNMLQIDLNRNYFQNKGVDPIRREGKLYDKTNHTYEWKGTQYCDILWLFPWEDLPRPIQDYIVNRSAVCLKESSVTRTYQVLMAAEEQSHALI